MMHSNRATEKEAHPFGHDPPTIESGDTVVITADTPHIDGPHEVLEVDIQPSFPTPDPTGYEATIRPEGSTREQERSTWGVSLLKAVDGEKGADC